jgi:hypothetical protein
MATTSFDLWPVLTGDGKIDAHDLIELIIDKNAGNRNESDFYDITRFWRHQE